MVGLFVRLKLALIRNGLRGGWQRRIGLIVGASAALPLALAGFAVLAAARIDRGGATDLVVLGFCGLFICWISLPVLGFGSDETLDPARLAALPLTQRQLMAGLLAASAVGVAPLATLIGLSGALVGFPSSVAGFALVAVAVVVQLALCIAAGRAVVTSLSGLLRTRRGRDLTVLLVAVVALLPQLIRFVTPDRSGDVLDVSPVTAVARWSPPGLAGQATADAGVGRYAAAGGELALAVVALALLLWWWEAALRRSLTAAEATGSSARSAAGAGTKAAGWRPGRPLLPRSMPFLPVNRTGAVAARELRALVRDPRRRVQSLYGLLMPAFGVIPLFAKGGIPRPPAVLIGLTIPFFMGTFSGLNQFGVDGAAYWTNVAAGNDPRADLLGKNLAAVIVTTPALVIITLALAALTGGWAYVPLTIVLGLSVLAVGLGVGNVVSVIAPLPLTESTTNMWGQQSGQGCATGAIHGLALLVDMVLLLPVALGVAVCYLWPFTLVVVGPLAVAYGLVLWQVGLRRAVRRVWWRLPELLDALSVKQAA